MSKIDKRDIGRKFLTNWVDPPLWSGMTLVYDFSGMTLATFKTSGKTPVLNETLMI